MRTLPDIPLRKLLDAATPGPWTTKPHVAAVYDASGGWSVCSTWSAGDDTGERMYGANLELLRFRLNGCTCKPLAPCYFHEHIVRPLLAFYDVREGGVPDGR